MEQPGKIPILGRYILKEGAPSHQNGQHNHAPFNGQRSHQGHQPQIL